MRKFKFEDLQPHVEMLCDALENKGASASGVPCNEKVYAQAEGYRKVISKIRAKEINERDVLMTLSLLKNETLSIVGTNQKHRIGKIVEALDIFIRREYNKVNSPVV
jgi:predicted oxidoreductase